MRQTALCSKNFPQPEECVDRGKELACMQEQAEEYSISAVNHVYEGDLAGMHISIQSRTDVNGERDEACVGEISTTAAEPTWSADHLHQIQESG